MIRTNRDRIDQRPVAVHDLDMTMTSSLSTTLSIDDISEILHRAAELLEAHHVVPETGVAGAEMLRAATAPHRYRHLRDSPAPSPSS